MSDLFLDTRPYNSHTVATDSLHAGVPVLSILGTSFASRVAASINHAAGIESLFVTHNRKEFVMSGTQIVSHLKPSSSNNRIPSNMNYTTITNNSIQRYRQSLRRFVLSAVDNNQQLFNSHAFASKIERAYVAMLELHDQYGVPARHLFFAS